MGEYDAAADYNGVGWGCNNLIASFWYVCGALNRGNPDWKADGDPTGIPCRCA